MPPKGNVEILSDTQGVDFSSWLPRWRAETDKTWKGFMPVEANPPMLKSRAVMVRFKVLPDGKIADMNLDGRSGNAALDRAAWLAVTNSSYPPLPVEFHGSYIELRACFLYNMQPQKTPLQRFRFCSFQKPRCQVAFSSRKCHLARSSDVNT